MHLEEFEADTQEIIGDYKPPIPKRRATVGQDYTAPPKPAPRPREKPRKHPLFSVGIGMCLVLFLLYLWNFVVVPWWVGVNLQWHYGDNRVSLLGADVGHGGTSRFIAFDGEQEIVVIEVIQKSYSVYTIPATLTPGKLITLSVADINNDGKPDLVVHVEGQEGEFVLLNTGSAFSWTQNAGK